MRVSSPSISSASSVLHMVITEQMQETMHQKMGQMIVERLARDQPPRARPVSVRKHDIAQHRAGHAARVPAEKPGKDKTLVGLSLIPPFGVDFADGVVVGEDQRQFRQPFVGKGLLLFPGQDSRAAAPSTRSLREAKRLRQAQPPSSTLICMSSSVMIGAPDRYSPVSASSLSSWTAYCAS